MGHAGTHIVVLGILRGDLPVATKSMCRTIQGESAGLDLSAICHGYRTLTGGKLLLHSAVLTSKLAECRCARNSRIRRTIYLSYGGVFPIRIHLRPRCGSHLTRRGKFRIARRHIRVCNFYGRYGTQNVSGRFGRQVVWEGAKGTRHVQYIFCSIHG